MRSDLTQTYRGYFITPLPPVEKDGGYYGGYQIDRGGTPIRRRTELFPITQYERAALTESIEYAKLEIDNLLAMQASKGEPS